MIISILARIILSVLDALLIFELPSLPQSVLDVAGSVGGYLSNGVGLLAAFLGPTCLNVLSVLLGLVVALNAAYALYSLVFWVLRKVPMLSVKE